MNLTESIEHAWGWSGIKPEEVVGENDFGNLIVRDRRGMYWRICPEDLSCKVVADDRGELDAMSRDQEFLRDWYMSELVAEARTRARSKLEKSIASRFLAYSAAPTAVTIWRPALSWG